MNENRKKGLSGTHAALYLGLLSAAGNAVVYQLKSELNPLWIIALQSIIALGVLSSFSYFDGKLAELRELKKVETRAWLLLHFRAAFCGVGGFGLVYYSYSYLPISIVSWIMAVPLAAAWAFLLLHEIPSRRQTLALLLSFIGLIVLSFDEKQDEQSLRLYGLALVFAGALLFSLGWVLARSLIKSFGERPFNLLSTALFALYSFVPACLFFELPELSSKTLLLLLLRGVLVAIAAMLYARTMKCLQVAQGIILMRLDGFYTPILGVVLFSEHLSLIAIAGGACMLSSAFVAIKRPLAVKA